MIGAIAGDIIGSVYESRPIKTKDFPLFSAASRFTDDTVLTIATAAALNEGRNYAASYRRYALAHPGRGYGAGFWRWAINAGAQAYGSYGNGSAMRVSPIGWAFETLEETREEAARSASVTHDHPEGIKGAQAVASAIFLARQGADKAAIRNRITALDGYDLSRTLETIRPTYRFDVSCQGSVPESIIAFLESDSWEDAVRNAVSLGGDADTMACIAGGIAEAFYPEVPAPIAAAALSRLPPGLVDTVRAFHARFGLSGGGFGQLQRE